MGDDEWLARRFEGHRPHLRAVAYRMLGSVSEGDDAVQEAWLRLDRSDVSGVENLKGWLTTVVARISLDMLRSRRSRREESFGPHLPDPVVSSDEGPDPEQEALLADSVGLALLVVLEKLAPPSGWRSCSTTCSLCPTTRSLPSWGDRPAATRQLASRARRRVQGTPVPDSDLADQRHVVDAFLAASRDGDFDALVAVLDPNVVLRVDRAVPAGAPGETRGAPAVAARALTFSGVAGSAQAALVNGSAGAVVAPRGQPFAVMGFTVTEGKIAEIDVVADPERLARLDLSVLG